MHSCEAEWLSRPVGEYTLAGPEFDPTNIATLVCTENLHPNVVVMKSTKDRVGTNDSGPLNGARGGASLSNDRCVLMSL